MALNGFSDLAATLTMSKSEYENLVRDSEKLKCLRRYLNESKYPTYDDIGAILDFKKQEKSAEMEE